MLWLLREQGFLLLLNIEGAGSDNSFHCSKGGGSLEFAEGQDEVVFVNTVDKYLVRSELNLAYRL